MFEERLLERIANIDKKSTSIKSDHIPLKVRSIIQHLQSLLNTRQGCTLIAEDYGIPDYTDLAWDDRDNAVRRMEQSIKHAIITYEKRLQNVKVFIDPDDKNYYKIKLVLEAVLAEDKNTPVTLETIISPDGQISINPT